MLKSIQKINKIYNICSVLLLSQNNFIKKLSTAKSGLCISDNNLQLQKFTSELLHALAISTLYNWIKKMSCD